MQNVVSVAVSVAVRGGTAEWSTHSREIQGEIGLHDADEIDVPQRRIRPQLSETVPMVGGVLDQRNGPHEIHQYVRLLDRQGQHPLATDHERSSDVDRCGVAVAIDVADVQPVEGDLAVVVDDELRIVQLAKIEGEVEIKVDIRIDMELTRAGQRERHWTACQQIADARNTSQVEVEGEVFIDRLSHAEPHIQHGILVGQIDALVGVVLSKKIAVNLAQLVDR